MARFGIGKDFEAGLILLGPGEESRQAEEALRSGRVAAGTVYGGLRIACGNYSHILTYIAILTKIDLS